jgi:hypothetical protein
MMKINRMGALSEGNLIKELAEIIDQGKKRAVSQVNGIITLVYWQVGYKINTHILEDQRAEYGKGIVSSLSEELVVLYGKSFEQRNLRRMMQFAERFPDFKIVSPLATQLSWSHFVELLSIKSSEARSFYAQKAAAETWSKREMRRQIEPKAFERKEIARSQLIQTPEEVQHSFKDPYFLDFLGLKEGHLENDLESAILRRLEDFILELPQRMVEATPR